MTSLEQLRLEKKSIRGKRVYQSSNQSTRRNRWQAFLKIAEKLFRDTNVEIAIFAAFPNKQNSTYHVKAYGKQAEDLILTSEAAKQFMTKWQEIQPKLPNHTDITKDKEDESMEVATNDVQIQDTGDNEVLEVECVEIICGSNSTCDENSDINHQIETGQSKGTNENSLPRNCSILEDHCYTSSAPLPCISPVPKDPLELIQLKTIKTLQYTARLPRPMEDSSQIRVPVQASVTQNMSKKEILKERRNARRREKSRAKAMTNPQERIVRIIRQSNTYTKNPDISIKPD